MKKVIAVSLFIMISSLIGCNNVSNNTSNDVIKDNQILWNNIEKKVWISEKWNGNGAYEDVSILITEVKNGKMKGYMEEDYMIDPNLYVYSEGKKDDDLEILTGELQGDKAQCIVNDDRKLQLTLQDNQTLKMEIENSIGQESDENKRVYTLKPYNLSDFEAHTNWTFEHSITEVDLDKWGSVKFVSILRDSGKRKTYSLYLTDKDENILYDFNSSGVGNLVGFHVKKFQFIDVNNDNRKDLILIITDNEGSETHQTRVYEQNESGGFEINAELLVKMDDEGNLKDIAEQKRIIEDYYNITIDKDIAEDAEVIEDKDGELEQREEQKNDTKRAKKYLNKYFPYEDKQNIILSGRMLGYYTIEGNITIEFNNVMSGVKGELWKVTVEDFEDTQKTQDKVLEFSSFKNSLHYFFVTKSKIYWIEKEKLSNKEKKEICDGAKMPDYVDIVCQNKKKVVDNDGGWNYKIDLENKGIVTYSSWYEGEKEVLNVREIVFKKGCGIIKFSSRRTAAGSESIELWDDKIYYSDEYGHIEEK